jgi:hypothetical protein
MGATAAEVCSAGQTVMPDCCRLTPVVMVAVSRSGMTEAVMYNYAMTTQPTRAMWWTEMAICLAVAAVTFTGLIAFLGAAAQGRHVTLGVGASILLIALSVGVGIFTGGRFRAWGLRRRAAS